MALERKIKENTLWTQIKFKVGVEKYGISLVSLSNPGSGVAQLYPLNKIVSINYYEIL